MLAKKFEREAVSVDKDGNEIPNVPYDNVLDEFFRLYDQEGCNILGWCQYVFDDCGDGRFIRYLVQNCPMIEEYIERHAQRQRRIQKLEAEKAQLL